MKREPAPPTHMLTGYGMAYRAPMELDGGVEPGWPRPAPPVPLAMPHTAEAMRGRQPPRPSKSRLTPPTYDGKGAWLDYKVQFETVATLQAWSQGEMAAHLVASLRGPAQGILGDMEGWQIGDYYSLVQTLERRFGSTDQTELYRTQMRARERKKGESLPEMAQAYRRLTKQAYPEMGWEFRDSLAKEHFIDALESADTRWKVFQSRPANLDQACQLAVQLEAYKIADRQRPKVVKTATVTEGSEPAENSIAELVAKEVAKAVGSSKGAATPARGSGPSGGKGKGPRGKGGDGKRPPPRRDVSTVKCHNCEKMGHYMRDCPEDLVCSKCQAKDHVTGDCPRKALCTQCREYGHKAADCPSQGRPAEN